METKNLTGYSLAYNMIFHLWEMTFVLLRILDAFLIHLIILVTGYLPRGISSIFSYLPHNSCTNCKFLKNNFQFDITEYIYCRNLIFVALEYISFSFLLQGFSTDSTIGIYCPTGVYWIRLSWQYDIAKSSNKNELAHPSFGRTSTRYITGLRKVSVCTVVYRPASLL